ncbi:acyl-CoA/acyl-ACP dehydrogenase [Iamia sp. SCSIO 61187]|uniref:acyl-CoA dehydrogenase family protein n=1 Tax=Iamia sp. SCSIO 61187 TaxID=2722752 RepID=UPI001C632728|nr:acyl-CoA dehydrogenase family protein [Iamia sp. SCSIO 61187]QYG92144.1 acyl-CoA/acyl-ACP dehydrogenase [Iamia sp. SCSIO 61187]
MSIDETATRPQHDLDDRTLERFRDRAGTYDRENRFFTEDLDELVEVGYLRAPLPPTWGGGGATIADMARAQRRLGAVAPPTALATTMHLYITGAASTLHAAGDRSVDGLLDAVAAGEIIASGHAETGNDLPILLSTTKAEPVPGGYRVTGRKRFGSLGPVWSRLGIHAMDTSGGQPEVIHAFVPRDAPGVHVQDQWDALGMRASQSYDTVLDDVFVPDEQVLRVLPAGDPTDPFFGAMSAWAFLLIGAVYLGIADRALELAVQSATTRSSIAIERGTMAHNPEIQHAVAEAYVDVLAAGTLLEATADACATDPTVPDLPPRVMAAKQVAVDAAKRVVDRAQEVAGGSAIATGTELERLFRDVRCGWFNGMNGFLTAETIGKGILGVDPRPRW